MDEGYIGRLPFHDVLCKAVNHSLCYNSRHIDIAHIMRLSKVLLTACVQCYMCQVKYLYQMLMERWTKETPWHSG